MIVSSHGGINPSRTCFKPKTTINNDNDEEGAAVPSFWLPLFSGGEALNQSLQGSGWVSLSCSAFHTNVRQTRLVDRSTWAWT